MSLATEMDATVGNILAARQTRKKALHDVRSDTKQILTDAKTMIQGYKKEGGKRKEDVVKRAKDIKEFFKSSTKNRMDDFKTMMKAIEGHIKDIKDSVSGIKKVAKGMLSHYHADRLEAARSWASLSKHSKSSHEEEAEEGVKIKKSKIK